MSQSKNAALPDGTELNGYRIVKKIASGGFSIVYLALDETGNRVALKEYLPGSLAVRIDGEHSPVVLPENVVTFRLGLKCFFEEGRALARIFHPNVVRVLNFFRANDTVYMVMNYESGKTLQEYILRLKDRGEKQILPENVIRKIFFEVMNGLREVHTNKMLHLDLKPANIYLKNDGAPMLLDFGAARQTIMTEGEKLQPMYTPGFAAPELYTKNAILGPWTDIYSIGASMYASMTATPAQEANARLKNDKLIKNLDGLKGTYSQELIDLVRWCLELDPLKRPQSVFSLQKILREQALDLKQRKQMFGLPYKVKKVLTQFKPIFDRSKFADKEMVSATDTSAI
ncbi:serine/threonine protein kinase [Ampullimonas aquatilis]|uniref:serine/threonine protein kinase n=1 Tax=Ampullimonas aquatilis TaxID=1341549 RepID=UPI003C78DDBB